MRTRADAQASRVSGTFTAYVTCTASIPHRGQCLDRGRSECGAGFSICRSFQSDPLALSRQLQHSLTTTTTFSCYELSQHASATIAPSSPRASTTVCSNTYDMSTSRQPLWQPLSSETSIRILTLHPAAKGDATITTTLEEVDLTDKPSFEAISYTWGTDESQRSITVNGCSIRIRQNLFQALSRFRLGHRSRVMWVDALCISQTDIEEKSQQVQQMGNIFKSAQRVLVWLGEHADESEALFEPWPWTASGAIRRAKSAVPNPGSNGPRLDTQRT